MSKLGRLKCKLGFHAWPTVQTKFQNPCMHVYTCNRCGKTVAECPECGSERITMHIMISDGYQYCSCRRCGHEFQDTSDCAITVFFGGDDYELEKPMVDKDGNPIEKRIEQ